jgi:histidinol-phosphate aminotransferase
MLYKEYISKLYRPSLEKTDRDEFICLDKNEPPFSAFDILGDLITDSDISSLRIYPDPYELYIKLSHFVNINIDQLLITQGSEQAIEFVFRIFLEESDEVVYLNPSFAMFDVFAYAQKANVKYVTFENDISLSVEAITNAITSKTKLFVLANPNNPTGTAFKIKELTKIAEHTKITSTTFLLDEAYFHFYDIDSISLIKKYQHIIITRTFSKALGIAGARVGYAISSRNNIELLRKLKPIDEINQLSNIIAKKVINNAHMILDRNIMQVAKWKNIFNTTPFKNVAYIRTEGNFILLKSKNYKMHKKLFLENKILPKMDFSQEYMRDCFRVSVSSDSIMQQIFDLLNTEIYPNAH